MVAIAVMSKPVGCPAQKPAHANEKRQQGFEVALETDFATNNQTGSIRLGRNDAACNQLVPSEIEKRTD